MAMLRSLLHLLLLASIQAGPVMAVELEAVVEWGVEKVITGTLGRIKGMEEFNDGVKMGLKLHKPWRKAEDQWHQYSGGGGRSWTNTAAGFFVDTVVITDGGSGVANRKRVVVTADITAPAPVRVGLCGSGSSGVVRRVLPQQSSIELLAGDRVLGTVKPPMAVAGTAASPLMTLEACPSDAGVGAAWDWAAVLGLGRGGVLSRSFLRFSYQVRTHGAGTAVWFPIVPQAAAGVGGGRPAAATSTGTTPLVRTPSLYPISQYYVHIAGLQIWGKLVPTTEGGPLLAYLSTTEPYTILDSAMYGRVRDAIVQQMQVLNPGAKHELLPVAGRVGRQRLCYSGWGTAASPVSVPPVGIVFANNAVMRLTGANLWSMEGAAFMCLAILPTVFPGEVPVIGSWMQRGRTMTIDLTAAGGQGTLTF